jgi:hypothetical protein
MTTKILPTRNEDWGFWGTMDRSELAAADPARAWEIASRRVAEATEAAPEGVRAFLAPGAVATSLTMSRTGSGGASQSRAPSTPRASAGWAGGSTAAPSARKASRAGFPT